VDEAEDVEDENNTVSREGPGVVCWWLHTHSIHAHTHTHSAAPHCGGRAIRITRGRAAWLNS
jgi:hypothetical protein